MQEGLAVSASLTLKKWENKGIALPATDYYHTRDTGSSDMVFLGDGVVVQSTDHGNFYRVDGNGHLPLNADLSAQADISLDSIDLIFLRNSNNTQYFVFLAFPDVDLSNYYIESDEQIVKRLEGDRPLVYEASSFEFEVMDNPTFQSEFTVSNLATYLYGIELEIDGVTKFVGKINGDDLFYDKINETWIITAIDWFKYHYDLLVDFTLRTAFTSTSDFLSKVFNTTPPTGHVKIIQSINFGTSFSETWNTGNAEGNLLATGLISYQHMLDECRKYFNAYLFVDASYQLNFIPHWEYNNSTAVSIDNYIITDSYEEIPFVKRPYDAIITNVKKQSGFMQPLPVIAWILMKVIKGSYVVEYIYGRESFAEKTKNLKILDLRQKLEPNDDSTELVESLYGYVFFEIPDEGNYFFPELNPLVKYQYLLEHGKEIRCSTLGVNLDLMDKAKIGTTEYQVAEVIENLDSEVLELVLRKVA